MQYQKIDFLFSFVSLQNYYDGYCSNVVLPGSPMCLRKGGAGLAVVGWIVMGIVFVSLSLRSI